MGGLLDRMLPPSLREGESEAARRARIAAITLLLVLAIDLVLGVARAWSGHPTPLVLPVALAIGLLLVVLRVSGSVRVVAHGLSLMLSVAVTMLAALAGGAGTVALAAIGVVPLFAVFLGGVRTGAVWLAITLVIVAAFKLVELGYVSLPVTPDPGRTMPTLGVFALALAIFVIAWAYDAARERDAVQIRAREQEIRDLLLALPDLVVRLDAAGVVREVLPGRGPSAIGPEAVGRKLADVLVTEGLSDALSRARHGEVELTLSRNDPTGRYTLRLVPHRNGALALLRDVTSARRLEEKLARAKAEAVMERTDRMSSLGLLAAGMAHEINNPLSYLAANLIYLEKEVDVARSDDALAALSDASTAVERIRRIVDDLRLYARNDEDAEEDLVELADVVTAALNLAHNELQHRATIEVTGKRSPAVLANETRLVQVVLNLLVNAAHALPPGGAKVNRVTVVTGTDDDGRAFVEVRDTGTGIPPELLDKVKQPFFTTKPAGVGTGLGLSVCDRIVRELSGSLEIESEPGKGTTVRVRIPPAPELHPRTVKEPSTPGAPPRPGRILVVDDDALVRRALKRLLRGHEVVEAESGAQALELIGDDHEFDLILTDVMMPQGTGLDMHRQLQVERPDLADRVVFMTGGAFDPEIRQVLGARTVIRKPFRSDELRRVLAERLRTDTAA